MTVGRSEPNRYIIISPGTRSFVSRNPGAMYMYVAFSRTKCSGLGGKDPDFAWNASVIVNEKRLCHVVSTQTTKARDKQISLQSNISVDTKRKYPFLLQNRDLIAYIQHLANSTISSEEFVCLFGS